MTIAERPDLTVDDDELTPFDDDASWAALVEDIISTQD
jgi:hypothetical protein